MRDVRWMLTMGAFLWAVPVLSAGEIDLTEIDRVIGKEPEYRSKSPRYGLLVLGPEAKTRVWIVLDGERLYVDRNADGNLSNDGGPRKVAKRNIDPTSFEAVTIRPEGTSAEHELRVVLWRWFDYQDDPTNELIPSLEVRLPDKRRFVAWGDESSGDLTFASQPKDAPIVHIGGPLQMGFEVSEPLEFHEKDEYHLSAAVGTPGLGDGTFAALIYNVVPKDAYPRAVLEFPAADPAEPPVRVETPLDHRC